jgi:hypothetical protein
MANDTKNRKDVATGGKKDPKNDVKDRNKDEKKGSKDADKKKTGGKVMIKSKDEKVTKKSGYNIFMGEMMKKMKEEDEIEPKERMKEIGRTWKEMTEKEKDVYNKQAEKMNEENGLETAKGKKTKSSTTTNDTKKGKSTNKDDKEKNKNKNAKRDSTEESDAEEEAAE